MRNFIFGVFATVALPVAIAIFVLLVSPDLRHNVFRTASEVPGFATYFLMRTHLINRDFNGMNRWLNWQLDLANSIFPGKNTMLPSLLSNATLAIERARFPKEFAAMRPFLSRLVKSQPDLLPARLWLARSLADEDPAAALVELEAAVKLASADGRAYRIAIEVLLKHNLTEQLDDWCGRYQKAQFGGPRGYDYNNLFQGTGLRRMSLEIVDDQGTRQLINNKGIQLSATRSYEFAFADSASIVTMRLHLGLVAGVAVGIKRLILFRQGISRTISATDLNYISWSGFNLGDGRVLIVSGDDEVIAFYPKTGEFGEADKVLIEMRFDRMSLASSGICKINGAS